MKATATKSNLCISERSLCKWSHSLKNIGVSKSKWVSVCGWSGINERESPTGATCQLAIDVTVGIPQKGREENRNGMSQWKVTHPS